MGSVFMWLQNCIGGNFARILVTAFIGVALYAVFNIIICPRTHTILDKGYTQHGCFISSELYKYCAIGATIVAVVLICVCVVNFSYATYDVTAKGIDEIHRENRRVAVEQLGGEENVEYIQSAYRNFAECDMDVYEFVEAQFTQYNQ